MGVYQYNPSVVAGSQIFLMISLVSIYTFAMSAIWNDKDMISLPCYKIMFFLGVMDIVCYISQNLFNNILTLQQTQNLTEISIGINKTMFIDAAGGDRYFVVHKYLNAFYTAIWYGMFVTAAVLSINRLITVLNQFWARRLFGGKALFGWFGLIGFFMTVSFVQFCVPGNDGFFNVKVHVWMYQPTTTAELNTFQIILWTSCSILIALCHGTILVKINKLRALVNNNEKQESAKETYSAFVPPFLMSILLAALDIFFFFISGHIEADWAPLACDYIGNLGQGINGTFYIIFNGKIRRKFTAAVCCKTSQWNRVVDLQSTTGAAPSGVLIAVQSKSNTNETGA